MPVSNHLTKINIYIISLSGNKNFLLVTSFIIFLNKYLVGCTADFVTAGDSVDGRTGGRGRMALFIPRRTNKKNSNCHNIPNRAVKSAVKGQP